MAMDLSTTSSHSVVSEFEGTLLKNQDLFSYFMLVAFQVGLIRFTILLFLWPVIALLDVFSYKNAALKLMIFVATTGVRESEIELVARAVQPKFYMDDLCMDMWRVFSSCKKNVLVTRMPRVMVEMFAKDHLSADEVIGTELIVNGFGFVTGLIRETDIDRSLLNRVGRLFVDQRPHLGLGRPAKTASTTFLSLCEEQVHAPIHWNHRNQQLDHQPPKPVVFHDGRLVKRPTPSTALLILLWFPFGIVLAVIRILAVLILPLCAISHILGILGIKITVKGKPPKPPAARNCNLLFVGNHRSSFDGYVLSHALGRIIPSISFPSTFTRLPARILSPVPLVCISRTRGIDAEKIKQALSKGDLMMFPEGISGDEPVLLRFSALFAELTNEIIPFAMNNTGGFFRATIRGWGALNLVFMAMNPTMFYEVTFLDQIPVEDTCSAGKSPYDVANLVQKRVADSLGFECTNLTRKDKYKLLT